MKKIFILLTASFAISVFARSQTQSVVLNNSDSLTLSKALTVVIQNHPSIKEAEEALNIADAKIGMAKSAYLPNIDASGSYTRIGPVPTITMPALGSFKMAPDDNYSAAIEYKQTLYDFGKTSKNISLENENKNLTNENVNLIRQKLGLATINTFYTLVYIQNALEIKEQQLKTLNDLLQFTEKKRETGSAVNYELISTKVRISTTESQKQDLEALQEAQLSVLNSLLGIPSTTVWKVKKEILLSTLELQNDSLLGYAFEHRVEMRIAKEKSSVAQLQYNVAKAQNNPVFGLMLSGGAKNGYFPDLYKFTPNFVAGVSLRVPLFDGFREKHSLAIAKSGINNANYESTIAQSNISNEVIECNANKKSAQIKMRQIELQVSLATEAFGLAKVNYKAGTITNLDLLVAETSLSESKLMFLKSQIDYITSVYKLKVALGDLVY